MKRKALWALIGVFLLGMGGGVLLDRAYLGFWGGGWRGGPEKRQARILGFLSRKLDLSEAQRAEIAPVLRTTWKELGDVRAEAFRKIDRVLEKGGERIRPVLNPEQDRKFERLIKKFRERRHRRGGRRGRRRRWGH